jgi:hypothetical protein
MTNNKCMLSDKLKSCRLPSNIRKKRAQLRNKKKLTGYRNRTFLNTGHNFSQITSSCLYFLRSNTSRTQKRIFYEEDNPYLKETGYEDVN